MLYPVLPIFLTQTLHASGSIVGLVDGFAQAAQNIVQGVSGAVSDWLQKRKTIALAGYFLAAVAKPLIGLSTTWQGVFAARFLDRLGTGIRSAPRDALIASSVDEKDRGRAGVGKSPCWIGNQSGHQVERGVNEDRRLHRGANILRTQDQKCIATISQSEHCGY